MRLSDCSRCLSPCWRSKNANRCLAWSSTSGTAQVARVLPIIALRLDPSDHRALPSSLAPDRRIRISWHPPYLFSDHSLSIGELLREPHGSNHRLVGGRGVIAYLHVTEAAGVPLVRGRFVRSVNSPPHNSRRCTRPVDVLAKPAVPTMRSDGAVRRNEEGS